MAFESAAMLKYGDKGNLTQEEFDRHDRQADRAEEGRPFSVRCGTLRRKASGQQMAAGEVVIQSMWSPAVTAVQRSRSHSQGTGERQSPHQGRLSRLEATASD